MALAFGLVASSVGATTIFADDFDAEPGSGDGASGQSGLDYAGFTNWSISDGTVDLVLEGDYGFECAAPGKCVDLDGSSGNAGVMTSSVLSFAPGQYTLEFKLGGVSTAFTSSAARADNIVDVSLGALFADTYTLEWGDAFQTFSIEINVETATDAALVFANQGGDNFGAVLDDVFIAVVPEPGTGLLVGAGLAALAARRRRG